MPSNPSPQTPNQVSSPEDFARWEAKIHAFVALVETGPEGAAASTVGSEQPLAGLTVGVKDIIDVAGLATRNGSAACAGAEPAPKDAAIVAALRSGGARIVGKTTTTEFAFTDPTNCRNPHDLARTPGGSSSGSGAAVAAGMVDFALGTQTAGSLCRPAAYCGAVAFKPSYGLWPTEGVTPLAPSFDTVGVITGSVGLAGRIYRALGEKSAEGAPAPSKMITAAALFTGDVRPEPAARTAFQEAAEALGRLGQVRRDAALPADIESIVIDHRVVMNHEAFVAHGHLMADERLALLKPKFLTGLRTGATIPASAAEAARGRLAKAKADFWDGLAGIDTVLTLPAPDGAPLLDGTTGFQDWLTPWTVFGGPLISLPWGLDDLGRPRAVMLAGRPGQDAALLDLSEALEAQAPKIPPPELPQD